VPSSYGQGPGAANRGRGGPGGPGQVASDVTRDAAAERLRGNLNLTRKAAHATISSDSSLSPGRGGWYYPTVSRRLPGPGRVRLGPAESTPAAAGRGPYSG
jgi:hypothetical protein